MDHNAQADGSTSPPIPSVGTSKLWEGITKKVLPVVTELPHVWSILEHGLIDTMEHTFLRRPSTNNHISKGVSETIVFLAGIVCGA